MFQKLTIKDIDIKGKRVLIRVDYNTPLSPDGSVADNRKITESLPTINYCLDNGASIILMSHLGRPKGKVVEEMRLTMVGKRLEEILGRGVIKLDDCIGSEVEGVTDNLKPCDIVLLENLRFHPEEEKNYPEFAAKLARLADCYVNDGFSVSHHSHASVNAISGYFDVAVAGFLMEKEVEHLDKILTNPAKPFVIAIGGAKVSTKIGIIEHLIKKADLFLIGGGMSYTFQKALGKTIGSSLVEESFVPIVKKLLKENMDKIVLPLDYKITDMLSKTECGDIKTTVDENIPDGWMGVDIGPKTIEKFINRLDGAGCILWNGPFGVIEIPEFAVGTTKMAYAISDSSAITVAGGGETDESIDHLKIAHKFDHVSIAGGACLEFLEGKELPGLAVLTDR
ncbi:phosphoglycerate kinase [Candidatus Desantisbacteria bacterium CG2_30_40_21]|uniref:Phosphoglycerate kinase n=2 Tax=unclassified Candidatus Desantisiibacteriota TaxID=3106372 RepID=A0A2H0A5A2_9BACT|nr:MAG: phosphoglycerate kinase [Candidatus Desantisbacteria bacterium CG2_30_40_21]PIP40000.1 MAG: phosphoglycerate kinase [Candidatus Desantisbacteria bacterium CG23_combo_of_CG06-09_8_20_14_all_40_23]